MDKQENPVWGRKIFFLNPSYVVRTVVIEKLREMEYEIYIINDYRFAKAILRNNPDSICLINVDESMELPKWVNFINSCAVEDALGSIILGVLSERATATIKTSFLLNAIIPAGFFDIRFTKNDELVQQLQKLFDTYDTKGRRQYIRAGCKEDLNAVLRLRASTIMLKLLDISTVGIACLTTEQIGSQFSANMLLRGSTVYIGQESFPCDTVILSVKSSEGHSILVMLFKSMTVATKNIIRKYVFDTLQAKAIALPEGTEPDTTDYSKKVEVLANEEVVEQLERLDFTKGSTEMTQLF